MREEPFSIPATLAGLFAVEGRASSLSLYMQLPRGNLDIASSVEFGSTSTLMDLLDRHASPAGRVLLVPQSLPQALE